MESGKPESRNHLGLGNSSDSEGPPYWVDTIQESQVIVPSEMFSMSDSRVLGGLGSGAPFNHAMSMQIESGIFETNALRHVGKGYNVLFADGHVSLVRRLDYLDPRKTAANWNNDHQPHPETWAFRAVDLNHYSP